MSTLTKPMKRPLRYFRHANCETVAKLENLKSIMRVTRTRIVEWWLVLPARGDGDAVCVKIHKCPKWEIIPNVDSVVITLYVNRINVGEDYIKQITS